MENNVNRIGPDVHSRISLFHGNVLQPLESKLVNFNPDEILTKLTLQDNESDSTDGTTSTEVHGSAKADHNADSLKDIQLPPRDIVCAFNYSCCCLHSRKELILYFKHALNALSRKGGIFAMDLYGGTSSEGVLRLQRRFPNFTVCHSQTQKPDNCSSSISMCNVMYSASTIPTFHAAWILYSDRKFGSLFMQCMSSIALDYLLSGTCLSVLLCLYLNSIKILRNIFCSYASISNLEAVPNIHRHVLALPAQTNIRKLESPSLYFFAKQIASLCCLPSQVTFLSVGTLQKYIWFFFQNFFLIFHAKSLDKLQLFYFPFAANL